MSKKVQKRLAAIMFTHLVEYDAYLKDDESFAIKVLNEHKKVLDNFQMPHLQQVRSIKRS